MSSRILGNNGIIRTSTAIIRRTYEASMKARKGKRKGKRERKERQMKGKRRRKLKGKGKVQDSILARTVLLGRSFGGKFAMRRGSN